MLNLEGSTVAQAALLKATVALDRIEQHEKLCGDRWALVVRLLLMLLATMVSVLGFLLYDRFFI